jgi:hypothetical protein
VTTGVVRAAGYHNYVIPSFVSCNHNNIIPEGRRIVSARLRLYISRTFGPNPFNRPLNDTFLRVDMVRYCAQASSDHSVS